MSHSIGAVRFPSGEIRYYEYNGTSDVVVPNLYKSELEVQEFWRHHPSKSCSCGQPDEPIEICSTYGLGFWWRGRGCLRCEVITDGLVRDDDDDDDDGYPEWAPEDWKKWREEILGDDDGD